MALHGWIKMDGGGNLGFRDPGSWMIQQGIEGFMYRIGDMVYGIGGTNVTESNRSATESIFIKTLTWNVDPYSYVPVREWQDYCAAAFVIIGIGALLLAFICSQVDVRSIDDLIGEGYTQNRIVDTLLSLLVIPLLAVFGVWVVLKLNFIISCFIADYMIMNIPRTYADNFLIYIFMAITCVILSLVMVIRAIQIVIFTIVSLIVGAAWSITELREKAKEYTSSFLSIVFLQPKLLFIMLIGVIIISKLPQPLLNLKALAYLALSIYLCWVGYKSVIGDTITTIVRVAIFRRIK